MWRFLLILICILSSTNASADQVKNYYFAAKRNIDPNQFHRADYLRTNHGSPYIFNEKTITAKALLGISGGDFDDPNTYRDTSNSPWVYGATDLALQITHWKKMLERLGIPAGVWRDELIAYEDYQIGMLQNSGRLDPLKHFNYDSIGNVSKCEELAHRVIFPNNRITENSGKPSLELFFDNHKLITCIIDNGRLSEAESLFVEFYKSIYSFVKAKNDPSIVFAVWEPSCECGNGLFSVTIEIQPEKSALNIISEFAYRVCRGVSSQKISDISQCDGHHQLGSGQRVYLAGDYRYQVMFPSGEVGTLRAIKLRDKDREAPGIVFSESGHKILE